MHTSLRYTAKLILSFCFLFLVATVCVAQDRSAEELLSEEESSDYSTEIWDPIEPVNRGLFWFNDQLYVYLLRPLADGYDYITPRPIQKGITNFFRNLDLPIDFVSNILECDFTQSAKTLGRFTVNTIAGVGGFFDIATDIGLPESDQDVGLAFASWGLSHGPYLVLPVFGPSSLRDGIGEGLGAFVHPSELPIYLDSFNTTDSYIFYGTYYTVKTTDLVNRRKDAIDSAKESSLDYYLFVQSAYYQLRSKQVKEFGRQSEAPKKADSTD